MHLLEIEMPTAKPRITITLTEQQYGLLSHMSSLGSGSMSAIVADMIETMVPVLERVVGALKAAAEASDEMRKGMKDSFEKAEAEMLPHLEAVMGKFDELVPPLDGVPAQRVPGPVVAPVSRSSKTARPPTSNRGVSYPPKSSKSSAVLPMKTKKIPRSQKI